MAGKGSESTKTVLVALAANLAIAIAKGIGGAITGSSALLAETAHSVADTTNQGLLLVSLRRSERPPDEEHPFGYGKERFFWVLLAAVFIFVAGGVFGMLEGLHKIFLAGEEEESYLVSYAVLGFALLAEVTSWVRAIRQTRGDAERAGMRFRRYLRVSKEPAVKTVVLEDTAAILGVLLAFAGVGLHQLTGNKLWDGASAITIGLLLCYVGFALGRDTKGLLIGEAARPEQRRRLREAISAHEEVREVLELLTMYVGPETMLVAVRLDLADGLDADRIEEVSTAIDGQLRELEPDVYQVFLDATPGPADGRRAAAESDLAGR